MAIRSAYGHEEYNRGVRGVCALSPFVSVTRPFYLSAPSTAVSTQGDHSVEVAVVCFVSISYQLVGSLPSRLPASLAQFPARSGGG